MDIEYRRNLYENGLPIVTQGDIKEGDKLYYNENGIKEYRMAFFRTMVTKMEFDAMMRISPNLLTYESSNPTDCAIRILEVLRIITLLQGILIRSISPTILTYGTDVFDITMIEDIFTITLNRVCRFFLFDTKEIFFNNVTIWLFRNPEPIMHVVCGGTYYDLGHLFVISKQGDSLYYVDGQTNQTLRIMYMNPTKTNVIPDDANIHLVTKYDRLCLLFVCADEDYIGEIVLDKRIKDILKYKNECISF